MEALLIYMIGFPIFVFSGYKLIFYLFGDKLCKIFDIGEPKERDEWYKYQPKHVVKDIMDKYYPKKLGHNKIKSKVFYDDFSNLENTLPGITKIQKTKYFQDAMYRKNGVQSHAIKVNKIKRPK